VVQRISKLHGEVLRDQKAEGKPVVQVSFRGGRATDFALKELGLKDLKGLRALDLSFSLVTDAGLKELKELKNLQTLDLAHSEVTDAGLKELKEVKNLQTLDLSATPITDMGLKELKELNTTAPCLILRQLANLANLWATSPEGGREHGCSTDSSVEAALGGVSPAVR
jgi:hypothetical protein